MTTNTLTTTQLQWLCALYKRECPTHSGLDSVTGPACNCKGTGRVPLLEGVREPCLDGLPPFLGWTPTEDAWKWLVHAEHYYVLEGPSPKFPHPVFDHKMRQVFGEKIVEWFKRSFFESIEQALCPLAINAAEAELWVRENVK